jgi:hypothetical protein
MPELEYASAGSGDKIGLIDGHINHNLRVKDMSGILFLGQDFAWKKDTAFGLTLTIPALRSGWLGNAQRKIIILLANFLNQNLRAPSLWFFCKP